MKKIVAILGTEIEKDLSEIKTGDQFRFLPVNSTPFNSKIWEAQGDAWKSGDGWTVIARYLENHIFSQREAT